MRNQVNKEEINLQQLIQHLQEELHLLEPHCIWHLSFYNKTSVVLNLTYGH